MLHCEVGIKKWDMVNGNGNGLHINLCCIFVPILLHLQDRN